MIDTNPKKTKEILSWGVKMKIKDKRLKIGKKEWTEFNPEA